MRISLDGLRRALFWAALLGGIAAVAWAGYIPAKAWLAQRLLERAWSQRLADGVTVRPWPWADTRPVARLQQSRLGVEQIVLAGSSGRVLAFGPGHVIGSAQPGQHGNVVLSGHRDTHFRWLAGLVRGDRLNLQDARGMQRAYRVTQLAVHHRDEGGLLDPTVGDQLRLVTCYPFDGVAPGTPWRYVVTARAL